jgi:NTE family protein
MSTSDVPTGSSGPESRTKPTDLVLEGGGVKGIGLVGAILELDSAGYAVKRVAGTSAGAIVASLVASLNATKQPLSELNAILKTIDYKDFMKNTGLRGKLGPLGEASGLVLHMGLYDGDYLIEWLGDQLGRIGVTHFSDLRLNDPDADTNLTDAQKFTLVVHTSDVTRKRLVRLPWDYPAYGLDPANQRVVDAVRASMAIPFFFEPVRFRAPQATFGNQICPAGNVVWVDGGMLDNYPLDVFDRTDGAPARWPTVGIKLSAQAPTVPTTDVGSTLGEALACLQTVLDNADRFYVDGSRQQKTIFVDSAGISATDFGLTPDQQNTLFNNGQSAAKAWIAAHE